MKPLLIITKRQFGHHTNYYKYCELLKEDFKITFICFDTGLEKLKMNGVAVKYIPWKGPKAIRGVRFLITSIINIARFKGLIYVNYFEKSQILKKVFPKKKMILDVRTLSISTNEALRKTQDEELLKTCSYYDHITPISEGVQKKLNLTDENSTVLPLGADAISMTNKSFDNLRLLYVGTLNGRNIDQTIKGLATYIEKHQDVDIIYDIIGDGNELKMLKELVNDLHLTKYIKLHGRIPHFKLQPFFDNSNIGISYIPMTEYYDFQPPTKTFEYIMSGMPCIATKTSENIKLITTENGVLCEDNPESFSNALEKMMLKKSNFNSKLIRESLVDYSWENIVKNTLKPILNRFK